MVGLYQQLNDSKLSMHFCVLTKNRTQPRKSKIVLHALSFHLATSHPLFTNASSLCPRFARIAVQ